MKFFYTILSVFVGMFSVLSWGMNLTVHREGNTAYSVQVEIDSVSITSAGEFSLISLPGANGIWGQVGKPQLPAIRRIFPLSPTGEWRITIVSADTQQITLPTKGFSTTLYPLQPPRPKNASALPFQFDSQWYADSVLSVGNEVVSLRRYGSIRGQNLGMLQILPVIFYNPATGVIKYLSRVQVRIEYSQPIRYSRKAVNSPVFNRLLTDILPVPDEIPPAPDLPIVYWVIYYDDFADSIEPFLEWKRQMGYDVVATPVSSLGTTPEEIQSAIQNAYDNWENPPDFVLLVGDVEQIPSNDMGYHYSDLPYFTTDGDDYLPDILYGRFSCATAEEVSAIVEKTLYHEKFMMTSLDYLRHPVFAACGMDGDWELAESTHRYVFTTWLTPPEFEPESLWAYDGATGSDLLDAVNRGALLVNYSGHGYEDGWANPSVSSSDISSLTNEGMYPLVISNACLTGKFDEPQCFAESWIRADNKGAVAFIGASNSTYWDEDDVWERRWYDAVFEDGYTSIAGATYKADIEVDLFSSEGRYYFEIYHNFGDPSLYLYWGEPESISVDLSGWYGILPMGEDFYDIPISVDSALVCLWRDGARLGVGISDGDVVHIVPEFSPAEPGTVMIVATKPNFYAPLILNVPHRYLCLSSFTPESLRVNEDNLFEITLLSGDSTGIDSAMVIISGLGVADTFYTDSTGHGETTVNPPYGEILTLKAYSGDRLLLNRTLTTYGAESWDIDSILITVPAIELEGSLAVNFEGNVEFNLSESDFRCFVFAGETALVDTQFVGNAGNLEIVPEEVGSLTVKFAKPGYVVIDTAVKVVVARGPFDGVVLDTAGNRLTVRAQITLLHDTDTVASFLTDWDGTFTLPGSFVCDTYSVEISAFGYYDTSYTFLLTTRGGYTFRLRPTPRSEILVNIRATDGTPLNAEMYLMSTEDMQLVSNGTQLSDGFYSLSPQPIVEYSLVVRKRGYSPARLTFTPSGDTTTLDITLEPNPYDILIVDLTTDGNTGTFLKRDLDSLGYSDTVINSLPDTAEMWRYNLVIVASGADSGTMTSSFLANLLDYHRQGGRLIFEGGDVAYQVIASGTFPTTYRNYLLHLAGYVSDVIGDTILTTADAAESLVTFYPAFLLRRYPTYSGLMSPTHADVVRPSDDAYLMFCVRSDSSAGPITLFPDSEHRGFARSAFFGIAYLYGFISSYSAAAIMGNLVENLLPMDPNKGFVYGKISLESGAPGYLAQIRATGPETVTDSAFGDGRYVLSAKPGVYEITFSRAGYRDTTIITEIRPFQPTRLDVLMHYGDFVAEILPDELLVGMPQPNPFNGAVSVEFVNPAGGKLRADIIDLSGRTVKQFNLDGRKRGTLIWRPENSVPSGVYFVVFNMGERIIFRKAVYIK